MSDNICPKEDNCAIKGKYPKSFDKCDMIKIITDRILEQSGNCLEVNKIRNYYDLILSLEIELENKTISDYFSKKIVVFKGITNLISYYFNNIKKLMVELNIRDDIVLSNEHVYRIHYTKIKNLYKNYF